jgi:integrase
MPAKSTPIYRRGKYWLDWDVNADGSLRSPNLTIFWYDPDARRVRSASARTADEDAGILALDRRYLADASEAPAFCHACGQPLALAQAYLLTDAVADYRLEWGDSRLSGVTIEGRLKRLTEFLEAQDADPESKFGLDTTCAAACTKVFVNAFRAWLSQRPVEWKNKDGEVTVSRPRSPAAVEAAIAQVIAVLNHAANADPPRSDKRPTYRPLSAALVQRKRRTRIGVPELAEMLQYAADAEKPRASLHAFLIGTLCTIARPSSVVDISVQPAREQWWPGSSTIDLNPAGRRQTKKFRAMLPVLPLLDEWLRAAHADWLAVEDGLKPSRGWLVHYYGRGVQDVDRAWDTMLRALDYPTGREWRSYVLRHSLATLCRNRGAERWDLEGFMGHRSPSQTEVYAMGDFPSVQKALQGIIDEIDKRTPGVLHRVHTGPRWSFQTGKDQKMSG